MFLRSLLLSHKPGTTMNEIHEMDFDQLEEECASFCNSPLCPKLTREEFEESQLELDEERMDEDDIRNIQKETELLVQLVNDNLIEEQQQLEQQKEKPFFLDIAQPYYAKIISNSTGIGTIIDDDRLLQRDDEMKKEDAMIYEGVARLILGPSCCNGRGA